MKKKNIMEAHDNAEAAALNLETAFSRPEAERAGLVENACHQLRMALGLLGGTKFYAYANPTSDMLVEVGPEGMRAIQVQAAKATAAEHVDDDAQAPECARNCEGGKNPNPKDHAVNCPKSEPAPEKSMKKHVGDLRGEHLMKLVTWTKVPGGIELAQHGVYQVSVTGLRGDWYYSVAKAGNPAPLRQGNTNNKKLAKLEGLGWADELGDEDERRATRLRTAGVGFDKLEAALENARSGFASDRRSCSYEGSSPATLDDVHNIVDNFVASLIHSLDPEPG